MKTPAISYQPLALFADPRLGEDDHAAAFKTFLKSCDACWRPRASEQPATSCRRRRRRALVEACAAAGRLSGAHRQRAGARRSSSSISRPTPLSHPGRKACSPATTSRCWKARAPRRAVSDADLQAPAGSREPRRRDAARRRRGKPSPTRARPTRASSPTPRAPRSSRARSRARAWSFSTSPIPSTCSSCRSRARAASSSPTAAVIRVHYDGKNGHPYSSIGRYLIEKGLLAADKVSHGRARQLAEGRSRARQEGDVAERLLRVLPRAQGRRSKPARWAP